MHARLRPVPHRFSYQVTSILIDIDRLQEANCRSALFSTRFPNLWAFRERDHGPGDGTPLRGWIDTALADAGVDRPRRVLLLCYPRVLGYVFNPLSVYFCYADAGDLSALVYEVSNTFGERHAYAVPVMASELGPAGVRQEREKLLHVSPFLGMDMRYRFRVRPPGRTVALRILETGADGPVLAATFHGEHRPMTTWSVAGAFVASPLQSLKIIAAIHWEAMKLWLKGVPLHKRPLSPAHAEPAGCARADER